MLLNAAPVILRPLRPFDQEPLIEILTDSEIMKWALEDRPLTREEAEAFIQTKFAGSDHTFGMHVISVGPAEPAIGFSGLRKCALLGEPDVEFGWVISTPHHGRGYATAIGEALIVFGLNTLRLNRVLAGCNPANVASEHILREKLGMRFEREVEPRPGFRRRVYSSVGAVVKS